MWKRHALPLLVCLSLLTLVGCTTVDTSSSVTATPSASKIPTMTPTTAPRPPELTFIGSDGNVWQMTWPRGVSRQLTTDGQPNGVHYRGLAWSLDGSRLAVGRSSAADQPISTLVVLTAQGTVLTSALLPGAPDNRPFIWSPDSKLIAYRSLTHQYLPSGNDQGLLTLFAAQTGQVVTQVPFDRGPSGCGGAYGPVIQAMYDAWFSWGAPDTFTWAPDQRSMLVAYACFNGPSEQIDPTTGVTQSFNYPIGATYQPGGNLILGIVPNGALVGPLGVVDFSNQLVRALVNQSASNAQTILGQATWSHDGQTIYYEYQHGIWRIGMDGANAQQIIAGALFDQHDIGTLQLVPSLSPDDTLLLYLQAHGSGNPSDYATPATTQWYVARADGSVPTPLPGGITEACWRPGT